MASIGPNSEPESSPGLFPETLWSAVVGAAAADPETAAHSLGRLCELYRLPIVNWFRREGLQLADAEDEAHRLLVRVLNGTLLKNYERRDARFRTFLRRCLDNQLIDFKRRQRPTEDLTDLEIAAPPVDSDPGLDRDLALAIHRRALETVQTEWSSGKWAAWFDALRPYIAANSAPGGYEKCGTALGVTAQQVKRAVFDLRHDYIVRFESGVRELNLPGEHRSELDYFLKLVNDPA